MYINAAVAAQYVPIICNLGVMNQMLLSKSLDFGLINDARRLQHIDRQLHWLLRKSVKFDFVAAIAGGRTLLVGEGNLSFTLSLAENPSIIPGRLIATTFENRDELSEEARANSELLSARGVTVLHGVDATALRDSLGSWLFDNIVFQFPHVGMREAVEGRNPNFILIRDFLMSAASQLHHGGQVLISAVDTPHYQGAFQFLEAAEITGFNPPELYEFDLSEYSAYAHTMAHQTGSALENHDAFSTWVFKLVR